MVERLHEKMYLPLLSAVEWVRVRVGALKEKSPENFFPLLSFYLCSSLSLYLSLILFLISQSSKKASRNEREWFAVAQFKSEMLKKKRESARVSVCVLVCMCVCLSACVCCSVCVFEYVFCSVWLFECVCCIVCLCVVFHRHKGTNRQTESGKVEGSQVQVKNGLDGEDISDCGGEMKEER